MYKKITWIKSWFVKHYVSYSSMKIRYIKYPRKWDGYIPEGTHHAHKFKTVTEINFRPGLFQNSLIPFYFLCWGVNAIWSWYKPRPQFRCKVWCHWCQNNDLACKSSLKLKATSYHLRWNSLKNLPTYILISSKHQKLTKQIIIPKHMLLWWIWLSFL